MANRFYQVDFPHRPAYWEDLGDTLAITGVVFEGHGVPVIAMLSCTSCDGEALAKAKKIYPDNEEWSEIIQFTDDPRIFVKDPSSNAKILHRKVRYTISGAIQQKIWVRDDYKCMYCNAKMGKVQLTVDHFLPLDLGGDNNPSNYLSACRKCNKRKGNIPPEDFLANNLNLYDYLVDYLARRGNDLP